MVIGGLQKLTLIDYPGKIAATVFTTGCNFRCPFCYSGELVLPEKIKNQPRISEDDFFDFLESRRGRLEGVVICGGEPCMNKDLPYFAKKIKDLGYAVKLDTNGSYPEMLSELISDNFVDYVAMDIKGPKENYQKYTDKAIDIKKIEKSVELLKKGGVDYEFRTTVVPGLHDKSDIVKIGHWLSGARLYYLQNFRPEKTIASNYLEVKPYKEAEIFMMAQAISPFVNAKIR